MRKGELLKTAWSDVDFKSKFINVRAKISKTAKARLVPMNETTFLTLLDLQLTSETTSVFNRKCVKRAFESALSLAKIENFTFHDLRHTFATRLGNIGADIFTIAEILGHSQIQTTRRYTHSNDARKFDFVSKLSQAK